MIIWTIIPMEMVLDGFETPPAYEDIEYSGLKMTVEKLSPKQCRIVRIFSTDPQDYLRSDIQPGTVLAYQPKEQCNKHIL